MSSYLTATQAKSIYLYQNLRAKVQRCCANIHFNRQCLVSNTYSCFVSIRQCIIFSRVPVGKGGRSSTVIKVLCYKSEGRWFDPSWCQ